MACEFKLHTRDTNQMTWCHLPSIKSFETTSVKSGTVAATLNPRRYTGICDLKCICSSTMRG